MAGDTISGGEQQFTSLELAYFDFLECRDVLLKFDPTSQDTIERFLEDMARLADPEINSGMTLKEYNDEVSELQRRRTELSNQPIDKYKNSLLRVSEEIMTDEKRSPIGRYAWQVAFTWAAHQATDGKVDPVDVAEKLEGRIENIAERLKTGETVIFLHQDATGKLTFFGTMEGEEFEVTDGRLTLPAIRGHEINPEITPARLIKVNRDGIRRYGLPINEQHLHEQRPDVSHSSDVLNVVDGEIGRDISRSTLIGQAEIQQYIDAGNIEAGERFGVYIVAIIAGVEVAELPDDLQTEKDSYLDETIDYINKAIIATIVSGIAEQVKRTGIYMTVGRQDFDTIRNNSVTIKRIIDKLIPDKDEFTGRIEKRLAERKVDVPALAEMISQVDVVEEVANLFEHDR